MFGASKLGLAPLRLPQLFSTANSTLRSQIKVPCRSLHLQSLPTLRATQPSQASTSSLRWAGKTGTGLTSFYSTASIRNSSVASFTASKSKAFLSSTSTRFFSSNSSPAHPATPLSPPSVGIWLLSSATLAFAIVVVGGVTRLTESGLSITEWKPVTGILPPLSAAQWEVEFEKYKLTPEFKLLNHSISLSEFKSIFYMEWGHRVLGRLLGLAFIFPLGYFVIRKKLTPGLAPKLTGMALLIGAQGLMGWYMVKSGLDEALMDTPNAVPRVSQYRLAAHLGLAFVLYAGMFSTGMSVIKDWKFAHGIGRAGAASGGKEVYANPLYRRFLKRSLALTGLVFLTALSGAFVAGLDAGLLYNEFPLMGGRIAPPTDELFASAYAKALDKSDLIWRNILENPTTVQFNHRVLAMTTYALTTALFLSSRTPALRAALPPVVRTSVTAAFAMVNVQLALGISTLLFLVPVPLAAAHQAGSVMLLSAMMHVLVAMRRPGAVARMWREAREGGVRAGGGGAAAAKATNLGAGAGASGGAAAAAIREGVKGAKVAV